MADNGDNAAAGPAVAEAARQAAVAAQEAAFAAGAAETAGNHAVALIQALRESEVRLGETRRQVVEQVAGPRAVVLALLRALPAARREPDAQAVGSCREGSSAGDAALASLRQLLERMDGDLADLERAPSAGKIGTVTQRQPALEEVLCDALDALSRFLSEPPVTEPRPPEVELGEDGPATAAMHAELSSPQRALTRRKSPVSGPSRTTGAPAHCTAPAPPASPGHAALSGPAFVSHSLSPSTVRGASPNFGSPGAGRGASPAATHGASPSADGSSRRPARRHSYLSAARQEAQRQREHTSALEANVAQLTAESTALRVSLQAVCSSLAGAEATFAALRADAAPSVALRAAAARSESQREEALQELDVRRAELDQLQVVAAELRQSLRATEVERETVRAEAARQTGAAVRRREELSALEDEAVRLRQALRRAEEEREAARAQVQEHARRLEEQKGAVDDGGAAPGAPGQAARLAEERDRHRRLTEAEMRAELSRQLSQAQAETARLTAENGTVTRELERARLADASRDVAAGRAAQNELSSTLSAERAQHADASRELAMLRGLHADTEATRDVLAAQLATSQRCERAARRDQLKARGAAERLQRLVGVLRRAYASQVDQPKPPHDPTGPRRTGARPGAEGLPLAQAGRVVHARRPAGLPADGRAGGTTDRSPSGTADSGAADAQSMLRMIDVELALALASLADSGGAGEQGLPAGRRAENGAELEGQPTRALPDEALPQPTHTPLLTGKQRPVAIGTVGLASSPMPATRMEAWAARQAPGKEEEEEEQEEEEGERLPDALSPARRQARDSPRSASPEVVLRYSAARQHH